MAFVVVQRMWKEVWDAKRTSLLLGKLPPHIHDRIIGAPKFLKPNHIGALLGYSCDLQPRS